VVAVGETGDEGGEIGDEGGEVGDGGGETDVSVGTKNLTGLSGIGSEDVDDVSRYDRNLNPKIKIV